MAELVSLRGARGRSPAGPPRGQALILAILIFALLASGSTFVFATCDSDAACGAVAVSFNPQEDK